MSNEAARIETGALAITLSSDGNYTIISEDGTRRTGRNLAELARELKQEIAPAEPEPRSHLLRVRVTEAEYARLVEESRAAGVTISQYMRQKALY